MTREEIREAKKKQFRKGFSFLSLCCLASFLCGVLTHWCVCKYNHDYVQKVEHSGSITVYVIEPTPEVTEDTDPVESIPEEVEEESEIVADEVEEKIEEVEEQFVSYYTYTEEELDLLARLIYSEGGSESYETKLKIGSVVMNRVTSDKHFPDTIREVIYQENQFSVTTYTINGVVMIDRPANEESIRAAKEVLDYGSVLPQDVQVFYADYLLGADNWVTTRKIYEICDNTVFSYIYAG